MRIARIMLKSLIVLVLLLLLATVAVGTVLAIMSAGIGYLFDYLGVMVLIIYMALVWVYWEKKREGRY